MSHVRAPYRGGIILSYSLAARYSGWQAYDVNNTVVNDDVYGTNSRYFLVDARVNYPLNKQFSTAFGVDNLNNDKSYAFRPMPQRMVHAELKYDY
jgi:iron complex outermembrane receptor protein